MNGPRVMRLLEEILESGDTPDEACAESPELLGDVRAALRRFLRVDAEVEAMFPASRPMPGGLRPHPPAPDLPRIPGYEVTSILGHGGMGVVYKARQLKLN